MRDRAQLVLAAAAVVAVALAPAVLAYLQLGYAADVGASAEYDAPASNAVRVLERAVYAASAGVPANHSWGQRRDAVDTVRDDLEPRLDALERARIEAGTAVRIRYNETAASGWADGNCPGGDGRQFGPCRADRGVVVQQRAGETHPVAVAFGLRVTTERGRTDLTVVVRAVGGAA